MNSSTRVARLFSLLPFVAVMMGCQPPSSKVTGTPKGMEQFASDKDFHAAHTMREPDATELRGKMIEFSVREGKASAYWCAPAVGRTQTILMVHEWWGLNENIKQTADMLQEKTGYGVLAVDLYEGKVATNAEEAGKFMGQVNQAKAASTVNAALRLLQAGAAGAKGSDKIGTIGFCFGGGWSHRAAIMGGERVKACAVFYGQPTTSPDELDRLQAPVLFIWPSQDKWINKDMVEGFKSAMGQAGKTLEVLTFDADHAFANPTSKSFKERESQQAWEKTIEFFKKNLG